MKSTPKRSQNFAKTIESIQQRIKIKFEHDFCSGLHTSSQHDPIVNHGCNEHRGDLDIAFACPTLDETVAI